MNSSSVPTIASIEQGRRFPPPDFVTRAEVVLDAFGVIRGAARHLSRQPGLASWFRQWAKLEAEAVSLYTYECRVVPGLLQTEAYARAVSYSVPPLADEEVTSQRIAARLARQELLSTRRKPPRTLKPTQTRYYGRCASRRPSRVRRSHRARRSFP